MVEMRIASRDTFPVRLVATGIMAYAGEIAVAQKMAAMQTRRQRACMTVVMMMTIDEVARIVIQGRKRYEPDSKT